MDRASPALPSGSPVSRCLPAPRAKDLLLLAAGVAMGAFLAFGPYLRPTRPMKAVLLTAPMLASLIVLRVLRSPPSDRYLDTKFTLEGYLAACRSMHKKPHTLRSGETVEITDTCSTDIHRMFRDTYFSSTEKRDYFQLDLVTKEISSTVDCVEKLKMRDFSFEEIEKLSIVWHQGAMGDLLKWMNQKANGHPEDFDAHHISPLQKQDAPTHRLWKIYREKGDLIIHYQLLCGCYPGAQVDQTAEFFMMGTRKINLMAGTDEMFYETSFDLSCLPFDRG